MTTPTTRTLGRDDWMTPDNVFRPLDAAFQFTGDACATDRKAARVHRFLSPEDDALATPWNRIGPRVWCNPPYGREIGKWFARAVDQCSKGVVDSVVMLTFANTDTKYWRDWVASSPHCHAVVFLRPRVRFVRPDGVAAVGAPKGSALIVFGARTRGDDWPLHCYADWTASNWVQLAGLDLLADVLAGRSR
jgi:phage N-6-adenine-methyltransferase